MIIKLCTLEKCTYHGRMTVITYSELRRGASLSVSGRSPLTHVYLFLDEYTGLSKKMDGI